MAVAAKPVKDNRAIKYGRVWPNKPWGPKGKIIPCPEWYMELCILRGYDRMKAIPGNKLVSWPQHFVNFTKIVFGDPRGIFYFEWNPNSMRILGNFYKHNILAIAGHKSCVPYETKILNPITSKEYEIGWLCENNIAPTVMTLEGAKQAEVPFLKGEAEIYEVTTTDGKKIRCTSQHRFLTPAGWKRLEEMKVGDSLATYDADLFLGGDHTKWIPASSNPLASNLDNGLLAQKQDAPSSPKTTEDSLAHYFDDLHLYDEQPHLEEGIDQSSVPSLDDAQGHKECAFCDLDGSDNKSQCSHLCSQPDHPSNYSAFPSFASFLESVDHQFQSHACEEMRKRFEPLFESISQSDTCLSLPDTSGEPDHGFSHMPSSSGDHYYSFDSGLPEGLVSYTQVASIIESGKEKFYDITVPGPAHYFAQGFINHNSGKTETLALIGAMWFFLFPKDTKVIVTSTTVAAAKDKVWGKIKLIWIHLEKYFGSNFMPGKLVDSQNRIRFEHDGVKSETRGIVLLASESSSEKESADKLQGTKAERMIVMGDEFATLKHSLLNTVLNNLTANKQCKLAGAFNPNSFYDPGGIISRPKGGWATITEDDDEWETEIEPFGLKGYCIRFDGEKSPNVVLGEERWKGLLTLEKLQQIGPIGTKTKGYYEQIRGFWSPAGDLDSIYTETEIVKYGADRPCATWVEPPVIVAALDPGFVHGGDRAALAIGKSGIAVNVDTQTKQKVFELTHLYVLDEDITNKSISKVEWVVQLTKEKLREHKVDVRNFAIDATGGGEPFGALIAREIGLGFINIKFSGRGSDMPVSRNDNRKGCDRFFNMASELWYVGRELVRTGQLKGLKPDVVAELVSRTYQEKAGVVQIESKKDMRLRTKKSPDLADAALMCLHVARVRHNLSSNEKAAVVLRQRPGNSEFSLSFLTQKPTQSTLPQSRLITFGGGWANQI